MSSKVYIEGGIGELRAALIKDGRAQDIRIYRDEQPDTTGAIHMARVVKAGHGGDFFLDLGHGLTGHMSQRRAKAGGQPLPHEGALIPVQITRQAEDGKYPQVSTRLRLAGRYAVIDSRVSKPIVRHAAEGVSDIPAEVALLQRQYTKLTEGKHLEPACLLPAPNPLQRILRDFIPKDCTNIHINDRALLTKARHYAENWPDVRDALSLDENNPLLFERDGIAEDLQEIASGRINLPQGAWVNITHTPALTAIDVNAGAMPDTGDKARLQVNLDAARAIARHLRLQNIGGLIVIDFIDVALKGAAPKVLKALDDALSPDPTDTRRTGFSEFGLVELNRAKSGPALAQQLCTQSTQHDSVATQGFDVLRKAKRLGLSPKPGSIKIDATPALYAWLDARPHYIHACEEVTKRPIRLTSKAETQETDVYLSTD